MRTGIAAGAAIAALALLLACAGTRSRGPDFDRLWNEYAKLPDHRALAVCGDPERAWLAAAAGGASSPEAAKKRAIAECRVKREDRRMRAPCRIYAVGGEIVW